MSHEVASRAGGLELVRAGADLCELVEQLYLRLFGVTLWCVVGACALCSVYAAAAPRGLHGGLTPAVCGVVALGAAAVLLRRDDAYRAARAGAVRQAGPGFVGAGLLLIGPYGPLWLLALSLVAVTAILGTGGQTLTSAAAGSLAYVAGTALAGEDLLAEGPIYPVTALALVLNAFLVRAMSTWLAGFVLRLHLYGAGAVAQPVPQERRPRRVLSVSAPDPAVAREPRDRPRARSTAGLTPRQLEVVLLLRDGLQQSQIAEALSISRRQVERHVSDARARTGARTSAELVARVVRDGLVPAPATAAPEPA